MSSALSDVLGWFQEVLDRFNPLGVRPLIEFDEPEPMHPVDGLPAFNDQLEEPEPRRCCTIGWQSWDSLVPDAIAATRPLGPDDLRGHRYGGVLSATDGLISPDIVGHMYTTRGGVIDVGHLRDHADYARYLASMAWVHLPSGGEVTLKDEGGTRTVKFQQHANPTPGLCARLGARVSYDLAIWHEIVTYASRSGRQMFSAFSPEDNYSNLLGANLGCRAMLRPEPFNEAMSALLAEQVLELGAVSGMTAEAAVEYVTGHWFRYDDGDLELLRRHVEPFGTVTPWLITDVVIPDREEELESLRASIGHPNVVLPIVQPTLGPSNATLSDCYDLKIDVDASFDPPVPAGATITDADLPALVHEIRQVLAPNSGTVST